MFGVTLAQSISNPILPESLRNLGAPGYFSELLTTIVTILMIGGVIIFVFIFISGSIQWITAGGDKGTLMAAKKKIQSAIIGLPILLLTFVAANAIGCTLGINILNLRVGYMSVELASNPFCPGLGGGAPLPPPDPIPTFTPVPTTPISGAPKGCGETCTVNSECSSGICSTTNTCYCDDEEPHHYCSWDFAPGNNVVSFSSLPNVTFNATLQNYNLFDADTWLTANLIRNGAVIATSNAPCPIPAGGTYGSLRTCVMSSTGINSMMPGDIVRIVANIEDINGTITDCEQIFAAPTPPPPPDLIIGIMYRNADSGLRALQTGKVKLTNISTGQTIATLNSIGTCNVTSTSGDGLYCFGGLAPNIDYLIEGCSEITDDFGTSYYYGLRSNIQVPQTVPVNLYLDPFSTDSCTF